VALDDAEQPEDKNEDQEAAKTDIHKFLLFRVADETENMVLPFPSLRRRYRRYGYYFTRPETTGFA